MRCVRLPRLLDKNMNEIDRLRPSRMNAQLSLRPLSTASMMLTKDDRDVNIHDFIELYGPCGSLGIYRVASVQQTYGTDRRIMLEHGIATLEDAVAPADAEWAGSMRTVLQGILSCQETTRWTLGDVECGDEEYTMAGGGRSALELLMDVLAMVKDCHAAFDQTTMPWVLHLRRSSQTPKCECRMRRNLVSVSMTQDDMELCTRVYADGLPNGYMDAPTAAQWGIVSRRIDVGEEDTPEETAQKAQSYLEDHQNPKISITLEALELERITGEPRDAFSLGDVCLVCLPEDGTVIRERIISISYGDLVSNPEKAVLTLSTGVEDASSSISSLQKVTKDNSRSIRKSITEIRNAKAWVKVVDDKVEVVGRQINLIAGDVDKLDQLTSVVSIRLDAEKARIDLLAKRTDSAEDRISKAEISLDGANGQISLLGEITDKQGERLSAAEIAIDAANSKIELKADTILLNGYVKASTFEAEMADIRLLAADVANLKALTSMITSAGVISADTITTSYISAVNSFNAYGHHATWQEHTVKTGNPAIALDFTNFTFRDGDGQMRTIRLVQGATASGGASETIRYLGR